MYGLVDKLGRHIGVPDAGFRYLCIFRRIVVYEHPVFQPVELCANMGSDSGDFGNGVLYLCSGKACFLVGVDFQIFKS